MKKASYLAVVIICNIILTGAYSQDLHWYKTIVPTIYVKALASNQYNNYSGNGRILYILSNENKLFRLTLISINNKNEFVDELHPSSDSIEFTSIKAKDSLIILGTNKKGIFLSYNMGDTWQNIISNIGSEIINTLEIFIPGIYYHKDSIKIFAGTKNGIYLSEDLGMSWRKLDDELNDKEILILNLGTRDIYENKVDLLASTKDSGIYVLKNNSNKWKKIHDNLEINEVIKTFSIGDTLHYAASDSKIYYCNFINDSLELVENTVSNKINSVISYIIYYYLGLLDKLKIEKIIYNNISTLKRFDNTNFIIGTHDKGVISDSFDIMGNVLWIDKNDGLIDKQITTLEFVEHYDYNFADIYAGTETDGVYASFLFLLSVDFSNSNNSDFTIAGSNDWLVKLKLNLVSDDFVKLELFDLQGNKVKDIFRDFLSEGGHNLDLDISGLLSGIYFIKLQCNGKTTVKKMLVAR